MTLAAEIRDCLSGATEIKDELFQKVFLAGVEYQKHNCEFAESCDSCDDDFCCQDINDSIDQSLEMLKMIQSRKVLWELNDLDLVIETLKLARPPILTPELETAYRSL
jgi:hypothetical protein